jgi:hypothetical protein
MFVVLPTIKGMGHSSEDSDVYGDQSGMVSIQLGTLDRVVACSEDLTCITFLAYVKTDGLLL